MDLTRLFYISAPVIVLLAIWTLIMLMPMHRFRSRGDRMIGLLTEIRDRLPRQGGTADRL